MRKFYIEEIIENRSRLSKEDALHLTKVLRMGVGEDVIAICKGIAYCACVDDIEKTQVSLLIKDEIEMDIEPATLVTLFQGLPKAGKMETIIQKSVELGVHSIVPVAMDRCVVKLDKKDNKIQRWQRVSYEACKQCGRLNVPTVEQPAKLKDLNFENFDLVLVAYENESDTSIKQVLENAKGAKNVAIVIGPEGGFEKSEIQLLEDKGGKCVTLGKRILRTETAPIAMISVVMYNFDEMK